MYYFAIHSGMPGYLPNTTEFLACETIDAAKAEIANYANAYLFLCENDERELAWQHFPCGPDASMWAFDVIDAGVERVSVQGLTQAEYEGQTFIDTV